MRHRAAIVSLLVWAGCASDAPVRVEEMEERAQEAVARGASALQAERWDEALAAFAEARRLAPLSPATAYNLGLAHARLGHELSAAAYFYTYLFAMPGAENEAQVRQEILVLERKAEVKAELLAKAAADAVGAFPPAYERRGHLLHDLFYEAFMGARPEEGLAVLKEAKISKKAPELLRLLARGHAAAGDAEGVLAIVAAIEDPALKTAAASGTIGELLGAGNLSGAIQVLMSLPEGSKEIDASPVVRSLIARGDLDGARVCMKRHGAENGRDIMQLDLAAALAARGKRDEAKAAARAVRSSDAMYRAPADAFQGDAVSAVNRVRKQEPSGFMPEGVYYTLTQVVEALLLMGDIPGARAARALADELPGRSERLDHPTFRRYGMVFDAYLALAEDRMDEALDRARAAMAIDPEAARRPVMRRLCELALGLKKPSAAVRCAELMPPDRRKHAVLLEIAAAFHALGDKIQAQAAEKRADELDEKLRLGWRPKSPEHALAVDAWLSFLGQVCDSTPGAPSRAAHLEKFEENLRAAKAMRPEEVPGRLSHLAKEWRQVSLRMKVLGRRLNPGFWRQGWGVPDVDGAALRARWQSMGF